MYIRNSQRSRKLEHLGYAARRSGLFVHYDIFIFRFHQKNSRNWDRENLPHDFLQNTGDTRG